MSKELYFIRHAKSSWEDSGGLADINRPLQLRGVRDAIRTGQHFRKKGIVLDKMISSNGIRALHTATIMAKEMHLDSKKIEICQDLYHADIEDFFKVLHGVDDHLERIALFSHNPGISDFAYQSGAELLQVSTNGVLHYKVKVYSWKDLTFKNLEFLSYSKPKDLH